jgi:DNA polymerase III epsilon subunit-like protein
MQFLLAVDLETTGLDPAYHEITQIGATLLNKELVSLASYESLVRIDYPERGISQDFNVFKFTNIDPADLDKAPILENVLDRLLHFIEVQTALTRKEFNQVTLFGQNTKFDFTFLEAAFKSIGESFPFDYHNIDLVSIFVMHHLLTQGELPKKVGLHHICKSMGAPDFEEHNAMNDITVTIAMMKHILNEVRK